ncbi:MAG: DUF3047 domain-containing protein [Thermoanaerobaculum sp.]
MGTVGALFALVVLAGQASAGVVGLRLDFGEKLDPRGIPLGWELKSRTGKVEIHVREEGDRKVIAFRAVAASFSLERKVNLETQQFPVVEWSWKATQLPTGGDLRASRTNDQAAQLLLLFEGKTALSYVWDTTAPVGTVSDESIGWPISLKLKVLVVKSGAQDLGTWVRFSRNVAEDFKALFGAPPPPLRGVRIQINTQHTNSTAEVTIGDITFSRP